MNMACWCTWVKNRRRFTPSRSAATATGRSTISAMAAGRHQKLRRRSMGRQESADWRDGARQDIYAYQRPVREVTDLKCALGKDRSRWWPPRATPDGYAHHLPRQPGITTPLLENAAQAGDAWVAWRACIRANPAGRHAHVAPTAWRARRRPSLPASAAHSGAHCHAERVLVNWASSRPSDIVDELRQMGLVPAGGSVAMTVPTSFGDTSSSGFNFYPLGQSRRFRNFVLTFDAHLDITGAESGCGMHFRNNGSTSISIGMVTEDGAAFLGQINNGELHAASVFEFAPSVVAGQGSVNRVTVVAVEEAADVRHGDWLLPERSMPAARSPSKSTWRRTIWAARGLRQLDASAMGILTFSQVKA